MRPRGPVEHPNRRRYLPGFLHRVLAFAVPVGLVTGVAAYAGYATARWLEPATGVAGARTTATLVVTVIAWWTLVVIARPLQAWHLALLAVLAAIVAVALGVPWLAEQLFLFDVTTTGLLLAAVLGVAGALLVEVIDRTGPRRALDRSAPPGQLAG